MNGKNILVSNFYELFYYLIIFLAYSISYEYLL